MWVSIVMFALGLLFLAAGLTFTLIIRRSLSNGVRRDALLRDLRASGGGRYSHKYALLEYQAEGRLYTAEVKVDLLDLPPPGGTVPIVTDRRDPSKVRVGGTSVCLPLFVFGGVFILLGGIFLLFHLI